MFTGIVEELGTVTARTPAPAGAAFSATLEFASEFVLDDVAVGASIAVNGCCLTVTGHSPGRWRTEVSRETLDRTALGDLDVGDVVNFERPLAVGARLGGHMVLGHVDGVGEVVVGPPGLRIRIPDHLMRYVVEKGSIAVDGISLTAFGLVDDTFGVAVIPHTMAVTNLGHRPVGGRVNIEVDILAKHVERLLRVHPS